MTSGTAQSDASNVNIVRADTQTESKIVTVNLYPGLAEVTRIYKLTVAQGMNKLVLLNLRERLNGDSLRVSGKGSGTIHNVAVTNAPVSDANNSDRLALLDDQKEDIEYAIERSKKCLSGLEHYLKTIEAKNVDASKLSEFVEGYGTSTEKFDARLKAQQKELKKIKDDILAEKKALEEKANLEPGDIEIQIIYVVSGANWNATYDIRVSTQTDEELMQVCYKASIQQNTGEPWIDVPLLLQTTSPSTNFALPTLYPWKVSLYKPPPPVEEVEESDDDMGFGLFDDDDTPAVAQASAPIANKSDLNTSYRIPGLCTIATHTGDWHTVTVQDLEFPRKLLWLCVPRKDPRVRLTADVTNNSDYTLVAGKASIFVDGSFLSSMHLCHVNPQQTFSCSLGVDQALRIQYPPRSIKTSESGFYSKSTKHLFTQRISVESTKSTTVDGLTLLDQVPVSEDHAVTVSLKSPPLTLPLPEDADAGSLLSHDMSAEVKVEGGVVACWHDANNTGNPEALGKDGMMKWVCKLAPNQKVNLVLQWEVSAPVKSTITRLHSAP